MDNQGFNDESVSKDLPSDIYYPKDKKFIYTFEEAVTLQGHGKFQYILLIVTGICIMSYTVEIMGVSMLMDSAKCDLNFTIYEQGMLASAGFLGVVLSSHGMGFFADTCGRVKTLKFTIFITGIISILSAFSISIWMLIVLRFLVGIFISGCQSCVFSYLGEFHGNRTRAKSVTLLSIFVTLGVVYIPAIGIGVLPLEFNFNIGYLKITAWRLYILSCSLPTIIALISLQFCPESPKFLLVQGRHDEAIEILKLGYSINTKRPKDNYPVSKIIFTENTSANLKDVNGIQDAFKTIWNQTIPLFRKEHVWATLNISIHQFVIYCLAHGLFMWFPGILSAMVKEIDGNSTMCEILNRTSLESSQQTDKNCSHNNTDIFMLQIMVLMGIFWTLVYVFFTILIDKVGKKNLLICWMILCGICSILPYWSRNFYMTILILVFVMGFGNCGGILTTIATLYFPTNVNAMGMCLIMMIGRLGAVTGSNFIGIVFSYNCELIFVIFGSVILCIIVLAAYLPNK